jgi:hypothetical protein
MAVSTQAICNKDIEILQDLKELKESIEHNASCLGIGLDQLIGKE